MNATTGESLETEDVVEASQIAVSHLRHTTAISQKWIFLGGASGFLGNATIDESVAPDGIGRYRHYQNGSIYWYPCIGAFEVHGLIRQKWAGLGWEKSALGYPKTDELTTPDGIGRFTHFQHGSIYYHPTHGTFVVSGEMRRRWADQGWERGPLGYPTSDRQCYSSDCGQAFSGGTLVENRLQVDLRAEIDRRGLAVRDQDLLGSRGTCSVFAMNFLLEWNYNEICNDVTDFSEEFLNHAANLDTGKTDDGDFFSNVNAGYQQYGIVSEASMPYQASYDFGNTHFSQAQLTEGAGMLSCARLAGRFIKPNDGTVGLTNSQFSQIISSLRAGTPVALGRGHSMAIVGFEYSSAYPGGGRFLLRNSYGPGADINGYRFEDFASVKSTANDAFVFTYKM